MSRRIPLEFESLLVDKMIGSLKLLQDKEEKRVLVDKALTEIFKKDGDKHYKEERESLQDDYIRQEFIDSFLAYDVVNDLMGDFDVEDIIINSPEHVFIHHAKRGFVQTEKKFESRNHLDLFVKKLVLLSGRTVIENLMNIELPNLEGRVNVVKSPFGPQITITKAKMSPLSIIDLIKAKTMTHEVAAQLWLYMEGLSIRPANVIIAGGPGVGKTTLLNALFSFVPETDRIVVIEDTLELNTEFERSCSRLESGEDFTLADLVKNSLRMRPERIVIGEVRGEEARDMMTAANIGKYCVGTIHALTSREAIIRLQNEPMNIPQQLVRLIDVYIILKRYHVEDKLFRVIDEISETSGMEQEKVLLSQIYKFDYETKTIKNISSSTIYRDKLARESGLQAKEIIMEVQLRAYLLKKLDELGHTTLKEVTAFCCAYNNNPDKACAGIGCDRKRLLGKK